MKHGVVGGETGSGGQPGDAYDKRVAGDRSITKAVEATPISKDEPQTRRGKWSSDGQADALSLSLTWKSPPGGTFSLTDGTEKLYVILFRINLSCRAQDPQALGHHSVM